MSDLEMPINWFPGHMAKSRRLLQDQLKKVDLVIELCDARLPYSSRNPELNRMIGSKRRILLLNKADLADPAVTKRWVEYFRAAGIDAYQNDATKAKSRDTLDAIQRATRETAEKALSKGVRKTIRAMVVGVPNVGKSTLINRLYGGNVTKTEDRPGVTRSNRWVRVGTYLEILDTPGMLWPRLDDQAAARRLCYIGSVRDEAVDVYGLTISLLEDLKEACPATMAGRFHLEEPIPEGAELLDAVCRGRGWLLKGGRYDYDRCCSTVLDEFRGGKLGRISLERPEEKKKETPREENEDDGPEDTRA